MIDFNTLKGVDGYRKAFPTVFTGMSEADTKRVVRAVHSSVLEGRILSTEDMQISAERILNRRPGGMTDEDVHALLAENRARAARNA
ncbi:hypothetical protein ACT3SZ_07195 [Corynebacterium sp. AOP40-9SA-29]|uniref:hypothetical protein n=1 Tax=Corynebacterium sp. AOP40-9SA-29 TaxID=3457677 RepID=UPI004033C2E6